MATLSIRLLGSPQLSLDRESVAGLRSDKALGLLHRLFPPADGSALENLRFTKGPQPELAQVYLDAHSIRVDFRIVAPPRSEEGFAYEFFRLAEVC